jgi:hypothetical protein
MTLGNAIFLLGATLEVIALQIGVSTKAVAWSLIVYGIVLLWNGYL